MVLVFGALVIALAVLAIVRHVDVRLVLGVAALLLGLLAGNPWAIVIVFFETFANERFVVPICTAMGFAYVLRQTGLDQHLVHLLVKPLTRVRWLLIPGTVVVGFLVNIPIISQTSTAATLGTVAIPILSAARVSPVTVGATLLLGSSVGGELLNPGAPELRTTVEESEKAVRAEERPPLGLTGRQCVQRILPLNLLGLVAATSLFWWQSRRHEAKAAGALPESVNQPSAGDSAAFRVNVFKALIPLLPLALLFLTGPPLNLIKIPPQWLLRVPEVPHDTPIQKLQKALAGSPQAGFPAAVPWGLLAPEATVAELPPALAGLYDSRLIGLAMMVGVAAAALLSRGSLQAIPRAFFDGAGYAFTHVISLIVTANCFGEAIRLIGLASLIGELIQAFPLVLFPASGILPLGFAVLCGSGMASTQSLFGFFAIPAVKDHVDPTLVGAVVSLAAAAGRTMSPVAAVTLMCATLTNTNPLDLVRRVTVPLLVGVAVIVASAFVMNLLGW